MGVTINKAPVVKVEQVPSPVKTVVTNTNIPGPPGKSAYQVAKDNGFVGTEQDWLDSIGSGGAGVAGKSAYQIAVDNGFEGTQAQWLASLVGPQGEQGIQGPVGDTGPQGEQGIQGPEGLQGPKGDPGPAGDDGDSAYQIAVINGFTGTQTEWLNSLVGAKGDTGPQGIQGEKGDQGIQGEPGPSNLLVLGAADPIPADTPAGVVIVRTQ